MKPIHRLRSRAALFIGVLSLAAASLLQAQVVPQFIDYQGRVLDGGGNPLASPRRPITRSSSASMMPPRLARSSGPRSSSSL